MLRATSRAVDGGVGPAFDGISAADIAAAARRLTRLAPLLALLLPELESSAGRIESELLAVPRLQKALGLPADTGLPRVKGDHALPVAGSIEARGGIHEVLQHAEALARRHGLLDADENDDADADYRTLASPEARALFTTHRVAVGAMASALGFRAVVDMSADAKQWKKDRLRRRGVEGVEPAGDDEESVAAGRTLAAADPACRFVGDVSHLGPHPSVYDGGLDNRTEADGLAVPRVCELAARTVRPLQAGVYTVEDETLSVHLHLAAQTENLRIEPSAAARFRVRGAIASPSFNLRSLS
ncbi:MAG: hypothetical protein ACRYGA_00295 [Janthinobacterium lividum]